MPKLTKEDYDNAISLGNAIDALDKSEEGDQPLPRDNFRFIRVWLDDGDTNLGQILKAASLFPDEEIASLLSCIYEKSDCTQIEWNSLADVLFHEYIGKNIGPEAMKILFG